MKYDLLFENDRLFQSEDTMSWDWQHAFWRWGLWESMQAGAFDGHESVDCPYCDTSLYIEVFHRYGTDEYYCDECGGQFEVDWAHGQVRYDIN